MRTCLVLTAVVLLLGPQPVTAQPWNTQIIDNEGDAGWNPRMVSTSDGRPYVLYSVGVSVYDVRLAWWVADSDSTGGWDIFKVAEFPTS